MAERRSPANPVTSRLSVGDVAWRAVVDATRDRYEVLAEIARDADGAVAFVGRPLSGGDLVVLKLEPEPPDANAERRYTLFELQRLDATVPAPRISCPVCAASVGAWRGSCPACGSTIGAGVDAGGSPLGTDVLLAFYQHVTGGYDVIGELATDGSGPPAYVVLQRESQEYSVLRLALAGSLASGQLSYVIDVMPLVRAGGGVPSASTRVPLVVGGPTAVISTGATPTNAERVCPQCDSRYGAGTLFCPRDGASLRPVASGTDLVGQLIEDRYYVEQRLGEGGMGEVYIAHQVRTGRKCALKLMHRSMTQDPDAVGRFRREASSACAISHPNVATIFDSGETSDRRPYFAMEFVDGRSLSQVIRDEGPLDAWRTAEIGRQIAEGLAAAHDLDIVHRDLKPDNVMLGATRDSADHVKLVDFGIAKPTSGAGSQLTKTGFILGTPAYMSPEQLCADKLDGRSDLYSLGCVLHEMLTVETPFAGRNLEAVMMRRLTEAPPHPRALNDQVPAELDEVVARLLARSPDERYSDARAVADALSAVRDGLDGASAGTGRRGRIGAGGVRTPTPPPREPGSVLVTTGNRPPRRSRDAAPPPPLSPPIPVRSPSLGITPVASSAVGSRSTGVPQATTEVSAAPRRAGTRRLAGAAVVVLVAGTAFVAWRLTRPAVVSSGPTAVAAGTDGVGAVPPAVSNAQPASPKVPGQEAVVVAGAATPAAPAGPASRRPEASRPTGASAREPASNASTQQVPTVAPAPVATSSGSVPGQPPATSPRDTKVAAPPPPIVPDPKPRVEDPAAELERAEMGRVREAVESYVRAIGGKRMDVLRQIFPGMNEGVRRGFEALFANASDLSTQLVGTPTVTVQGTTADAEFVYEVKGQDPSRGAFSQRPSLRAKLQRTDQGWIFQSVGAAR